MTSRTHAIALALSLLLIAAGDAPGAERYVDGEAKDWCFGAPSSRRIENSAARLGCGFCDGDFYLTACLGDNDCSAGQVCSGSQEETVWFDARTDSVANDLRTVATAQE